MIQVAQRSFKGQKCIWTERCLVLAHGAVTSTVAYEDLSDASSIWAGELNGKGVGGEGRQKLVLYSNFLEFLFSSENHGMRIQMPSDTPMNLFSAHMLGVRDLQKVQESDKTDLHLRHCDHHCSVIIVAFPAEGLFFKIRQRSFSHLRISLSVDRNVH